MNISTHFILRPRATSLLMLAIVFCGYLAYQFLPVAALPEVEYPTIRIMTVYPGSSPEVTAALITAPLERQCGQIPGLQQMTSSSSMGLSLITLQFSLTRQIDIAEQDVQAAINAARNYLPNDLTRPPVYSKVNPADPPIISLALTSDHFDLTELTDYAETHLIQKISQISGVGLVSTSGSQRRSIRIQVNPLALSSKGLTLENIRYIINQENVNQAKGTLTTSGLSYIIDSNDQLLTSNEYKKLIIGYVNGSALRLEDVADVVDGPENMKQAAWLDHKPAIILNIQKQPGANVIHVVDDIKKFIFKTLGSVPPSMTITLLNDRTETIRASIGNAKIEMLLALVFVVVVIYCFLGNIITTVIPSLAIPIALIGTLAVMYFFNFSVNNLTIMAMTVAAGFVIDDGIVMIENITRYIEKGEKPIDAAIKGSKEMTFTIVSLTLSLIAVLIPLFFMQDVIGRLFREFAYTLTATIIISLFVALTLIPMLCAQLLKKQEKENKQLQSVIAQYAGTLQWTFGHQRLILCLTGVIVLLTCLLAYLVPKGFFPQQDIGLIQVITEVPGSASFAVLQQRQQELAKIIIEHPAVDRVVSFIGVDGMNSTSHRGRFQVMLKTQDKRRQSIAHVMEDLNQKAKSVEGISAYFQSTQDIVLDNRISKNQYQLTVSAQQESTVEYWTQKLIDKLSISPIMNNVSSDNQSSGLQTRLYIDRDIAAYLGITMSDINNVLYDAFGQRQISTLYTQFNQYFVIMEILPVLQGTLDHLYLKNTAGDPIPLSLMIKTQQETVPLAFTRQNQFPVSTISFNLNEGYSLSQALEAIEMIRHTLEVPSSVEVTLEGLSSIFKKSLSHQLWLCLAAVVVVYLVLGMLYESYIHPLIILSTLPPATFGALLTLFLTKTELSIVALIGIILLIGIVMKNAIIMIDFALTLERQEAKTPQDAIYEACLLRFRPIIMTTATALLGSIPLLFNGVGCELRQPLGLVIIGGLIVSQVLTLYTIPAIYLFFNQLSKITISAQSSVAV